jgi:FMN-dependent NADH-azoreductase
MIASLCLGRTRSQFQAKLKDTPYSAYDRQQRYLQLIFGFIGITDIEVIHADNLMGGKETRSQDLADAQAALQAAGSR